MISQVLFNPNHSVVLRNTSFTELTKPVVLNFDQSCSCSACTNHLGIERPVVSRVVYRQRRTVGASLNTGCVTAAASCRDRSRTPWEVAWNREPEREKELRQVGSHPVC